MKRTAIIPVHANYVSYWSVGAGIREFWANAKDGAHNVEGDFGYEYHEVAETLVIWNKSPEPLKTSMLVLGLSSKTAQSDSVGQFGEGAKVGFCVLAREGIKISCQNKTELWHVGFRYDKSYDAEVMHVDIQENALGQEQDKIRFIFENVTREHMDSFERYTIEHYIESQKKVTGVDTSYVESSVGKVYLGMPAAVFVSGIRIEDASVGFCVDLNPDQVSLTRDRNQLDWHKAMDLSRTITLDVITKENMELFTRYGLGTTVSRLTAALSKFDDDEKDGNEVDPKRALYEDILKSLLAKEIEAAEDQEQMFSHDYDGREKAKRMGIDTVLVDYTYEAALYILGYDISKRFWDEEEFSPKRLVPALRRTWDRLSSNMHNGTSCDEDMELMQAKIDTIILASESWYQG